MTLLYMLFCRNAIINTNCDDFLASSRLFYEDLEEFLELENASEMRVVWRQIFYWISYDLTESNEIQFNNHHRGLGKYR